MTSGLKTPTLWPYLTPRKQPDVSALDFNLHSSSMFQVTAMRMKQVESVLRSKIKSYNILIVYHNFHIKTKRLDIIFFGVHVDTLS